MLTSGASKQRNLVLGCFHPTLTRLGGNSAGVLGIVVWKWWWIQCKRCVSSSGAGKQNPTAVPGCGGSARGDASATEDGTRHGSSFSPQSLPHISVGRDPASPSGCCRIHSPSAVPTVPIPVGAQPGREGTAPTRNLGQPRAP